MTISAPPALARLGEVAGKAGAQPILNRLRAVSLSPDTRNFVGIFVSYLTQRERLQVLSHWAAEHGIAAELEIFGRAAWHDGGAQLLRDLRPIGSQHLATRQLHGYMQSHYLVAMAATRRAYYLVPSEPDNPDTPEKREQEAFLERLRLLLLIRALEAADEGILREANLAEACKTVRQAADDATHPSWSWIKQIRHSSVDFGDFVNETCFQLQKALGAAASSERSFYTRLKAVLDKDFKAIRDKNDISTDTSQTHMEMRLPGRDRLPAPAMPVATPEQADVHLEDGPDESRTFAFAEIDTTRPAPAQRDQGTGVVIESLEDSQYLRHSWHRLNRLEEAEFLQRALHLMQGAQSAVDRLGAALTVVAMLTSTPLSGLGSMLVQSGLTDDWSLDLREGTLRRRPPRFPRRWKPSDAKTSSWLRPVVAEWRIDLSDLVRSALGVGERRRPHSTTVGKLWDEVSPSQPLHVWFGQSFAGVEPLERLTAPAVSRVIGQQTFEHQCDHVQARLVSSSTRSGLPSACTYGAYSATEIRNALASTFATALGTLVEPGATSDGNATGSELDVDLKRVAAAIRGMIRSVNELVGLAGRWAEHHNRLTALCVVALLASTGARPVNSPFESLDWIDLDRGFIYVEDKHSGPTRGARLCVLSDFARELLTNHYLPHLASLVCALEKKGAAAMSVEIRKILDHKPDCRLPLFFLLRAQPSLDWLEVSESQLTMVWGNRWPLPWNAFRHLHSTQLRRWGLNPEIRDALLSHGDRGAESHGEFSWRVPELDLEEARPKVNRLVEELEFQLPKRDEVQVTTDLDASRLDFNVSVPFGRNARALRRKASHEAAKRAANADISRLINNRPPSSLAPQEWDRIAEAMLRRSDGLPHPMASLRYEVLEEYVASIWRQDGTHLNLPTKRYVPLREGASIFNEDVIGAADRLEMFRRDFDAILQKDSVRIPRRPVLAGCLAALELVLHCRVSHFAVLAAVACNSSGIRIIRFNERYWLEWAYRGDWKDGRPNYRVPITDCAAGWIGEAQEARKRLDRVPDTPEALQSLVGKNPEGFGLRLKELASWVGQINSFELPGAMAAALSGARETAALPHADWIRTTLLELPRDTAGLSSSLPEVAIDAADEFFRSHHRAVSEGNSNALPRCRELFSAIQQILSEGKLATAPREDEPSRDAAIRPQERAADMARAVRASGFGPGDAPFVMAHYALHLLKRPKRAGRGGTLKASTALRYWETLKPGFLDFAFDTDLRDLEEEELTELYAKIVNAASASLRALTPESWPGHARRRTLKDDTDAGQRALDELVRFHEFARGMYGLEDPDWAEIAPGKAVGHGRPGIVLIDEYRAALATLIPHGHVQALDDDSLAAAFVLFACARFGLRGGEAVGLQRRDWVQIAGSIVVLVRSSRVRTLKSIRSKRQVPLIDTLSSLEQALVDETLRRWEHRDGVNRNSLLLPGVSSKGFKGQQRWISARLLPLIKSVTGNPASTIHHLRHGFACRLLVLLCGRELGVGVPCTFQQTDDAKRLLMTSHDPGRRTLWAVARMLGHASPATTLKAYAHVMDAWLPEPVPRPSAVDPTRARLLVNLDNVPRDATYLARPAVVPATKIPIESLWVRSLRYLRLRALGNADAAWLSQLDQSQVERLDDCLRQAVARLKIMSAEKRTVSELLAGIRPARWKAMVDLVLAAPDATGLEFDATGSWTSTIGASRHIVLFEPEHFKWAGRFARALGMTPDDCKIVHASPSGLMDGITEAGLASYAITKTDYAPSFQIDRARETSPGRFSERFTTHRVALLPVQSGRVKSTVELVVLWVSWLYCGTSLAGEASQSA